MVKANFWREGRAFWAALMLVLASCAQIGTPSGGPKDELPPSLVAAFPPLGATLVESSSLTLLFDEYVRAGQWRSQLLVSPPIEGPMDLIVRGKEVELTWDAPLQANRTYVFQFGDAIVDVNEGNPALDLVHAFSTGPQLDSLTISGQVLNGITQLPSANMRVLLYPESWQIDSALNHVPPQYLGVTDAEGSFEIGYLPPNSFRIMALQDANRNYGWDAGEAVAVGPTNAVAGDSTELVLRSGSTESPATPFLSEAVRDALGWASWKLSESAMDGDSLSFDVPTDLQLMPVDGQVVSAWGWSAKEDSASLRLVWHHEPKWPKDTWATDTLEVPSPRLVDVAPVVLRKKPTGLQLPGTFPKLQWSRLITAIDTSRVALAVDSLDIDMVVETKWPTTTFALSHDALRRPGAEVSCTFLPGALIGVGQSVWPEDTTELVWSNLKKEQLSDWTLNVTGLVCPGLIEILDSKDNRLSEVVYVKRDTVLRWPQLKPGFVKALWWGDLDEDGVWRDVDVESWRAPEPVQTMEPVELRANWEIETTWTLDSSQCHPISH